MALLNRLSSSQAIADAKSVKSLISNRDNTPTKAFFNDLSSRLDLLVNEELATTTITRYRYELNRAVRKRNSIFSAIKPLKDKYGTAQSFFKNFVSRDDELANDIQELQSVFFSLNSIYTDKKYQTKEFSFVQTAISRDTGNINDIRGKIKDYNNFFFGEE